MKNKTWLFVFALLAMSPSGKAFAESYGVEVTQQSKVKLVTGEVYDDQGPVIGATVMVKGTTNGQITDVDGKFSLRVPVGATIVVSFVGYEEKEIVYKGEERLRIPMSEDITQLQEVQVIAYGTTKKVTVTGALSSVGTDEILKSPVGSVGNALAGKVPGLSAVQSSGQPGADDATLYVRGVGSLSTGLSTPLCLVDGVERSFTQIDPNEIEDITVLKDASATAVFGVRGANGVILVTTKRGQEGKAKVTFSTSMSVQMPTKIPEFANSYEYATTYNQAQLRDGVSEDNLMFSDEMIEAFRTHSDPILYPDVDWTDLMIKNAAWQTQHNLTISGGSDRVRYFASLGVFTQDGLFETFHEHDKGFKYNEPIDVIIRPEDIKIVDVEDKKCLLKAEVLSCVFKGDHYQVTALTYGEEERNEIIIHDNVKVGTGDTIGIYVKPFDFHIMHKSRLINTVDGVIYEQGVVEFCEGRFPCNSTLPEGTNVKVSIDFDDVELTDDEEDGVIGATVISSIYKGSYWQYIVRTDDYYDFFVDTEYEWLTNDRVGIKVAPDKLIVEAADEKQDN